MIKLAAALGALLLAVLAPLSFSVARDPSPATRPPAVVVGTFDSRAVALAFLRSERFSEEIARAQEEMEQARAVGDEERVQAVEDRMQTRQELSHREVFCAAPAPEILGLLQDRMDGFAAAAGVDVIVSKWQLAYAAPEARFVDLTGALVGAFDPDQETLKVVEQIVVTEPLPLDALQHEH